MEYKEFRKKWFEQHSGEYTVSNIWKWVNVLWQGVLVFVILIATSFISMVHSVPSIYNTVDWETLSEILPWIQDNPALIAIAAFVGFELGLFVIGFLSAQTIFRKAKDVHVGTLMWIMLTFTMIVLLGSNVYSSLSATVTVRTQLMDWIELIVAVAVGLVAPANGLLAGHILAFIIMAVTLEERNRRVELNKRINTAYTVYKNRENVNNNVNAVNVSVNVPKHLEIRKQLEENPERYEVNPTTGKAYTVAELADMFEVSTATISKAKNPEKYPG